MSVWKTRIDPSGNSILSRGFQMLSLGSGGNPVNCRLVYIFMTRTSACLRCHVPISIEATVCPACGYAPQRSYKSEGGFAKVAGFLISLTIVGSVIGMPLWWYGRKRVQQAQGMKPTNTRPDSVTESIDI